MSDIRLSASESAARAPKPVGPGYAAVPDRPHAVQFYEDHEGFLDGIARFLGEGFGAGEAQIVIAREKSLAGFERRLKGNGFDLLRAREQGRYLAFDANETLSRFMVGKRPEVGRFRDVIGGLLAQATGRNAGRRVRVFGEMVAVLWADGNADGAIALERLWNGLDDQPPFALRCAYSMDGFRSAADGEGFRQICAEHSAVVPAESFSSLDDSDGRLRVIAALQQKALALEQEIAHRNSAERQLQKKVEELAAADRRKDEFLAMLGHELRNPLSPIVTALHRARLRRDEPEVSTQSLEVIERQTERLTRLVEDLLEVSRISQGKIVLREETALLAAIVDRAVEQARPLIEERKHRLETRVPEVPVWLRADPNRLEQILMNLLSNAAKYTEPGGSIRLAARIEGEDATLTITDNGVGLPPELRESVFDLFVQNPESAARMPGGLGIGLTLVRRLVELHGGTVEVASDGPGRGCEFRVRLPGRVVSPSTEVEAVAALAVTADSTPKRRILVVDDNSDVAEGLSELLRELGHDVRTAPDGAAAIETAAALNPEIVFLDIAMPGMDGYEVARRLRRELGLHGALLVAVTGYGQDRDRQLCGEAGFDRHFVKPIDIQSLESLLAYESRGPSRGLESPGSATRQ